MPVAAIALPNNENHAYTLQQGQWHAGVWDLGYGISEDLEISSAWTFMLLRIPNAVVKYRVYDGDQVSVSVSSGLFYYDNSFHDADDTTNFTASLVPTSIIGTWDAKPFFLSGSLVLTQILSTGSPTDNGEGEDFNLQSSALNIETLIFRPALYWDRGNGFAWLFDLTISLSQTAGGQADSVQYYAPDERISGRAILQGRGEVDLTAERARNFSVSALWYWEHVHVKLGLTMGHLMLPYLNTFPVDDNNRPVKLSYPKFDLYWRF